MTTYDLRKKTEASTGKKKRWAKSEPEGVL